MSTILDAFKHAKVANHTMVKAMVKGVTLCLYFLCLSHCSGHRVIVDPIDAAADKHVHVKAPPPPTFFHNGAAGSSQDYDDDAPPVICAGGLGNYLDLGPFLCCCQPCGSGSGPEKLPRGEDLDPDEDSCCPIETMVESYAYWGCCNCPGDGQWIIRWNSSGDPMMNFKLSSSPYKQPNHLNKLEKLAHKVFKINREKQDGELNKDEHERENLGQQVSHKIFKINHKKQDKEFDGDEPQGENLGQQVSHKVFKMNHKKQDSEPNEDEPEGENSGENSGQQVAHKVSKTNHGKQDNKPNGNEPQGENSGKQVSHKIFKTNHEKQDNEPNGNEPQEEISGQQISGTNTENPEIRLTKNEPKFTVN